MEVRNRDGEPVDAVPFLISTGILGMLTLSVGPLYGLAYGVPVGHSNRGYRRLSCSHTVDYSRVKSSMTGHQFPARSMTGDPV